MHRRSRIFIALMGGALVLAQAGRAAGESLPAGAETTISADETLVYVHEAKKIEVRARIPGASTDETGPKWNLVQVNSDGSLRRYLGVLYYSPKRQAFFRKLELQEREPGQRYFEVVPDAELEPFVAKSRARLVIEVAGRPSLIEILQSVWKKLLGRTEDLAVFERAVAAEPKGPGANGQRQAERRCRERIEGVWSAFDSADFPAGTRVQKGALEAGGVYAALAAVVDFPAAAVAETLWNPANLKNSATTRLKLEELVSPPPGISKARRIDVNLRPFLFVSLDWQELWERRDAGSSPAMTRIDYRKTAGEERLKHFCGWMEIRKLEESRTEVILLEEIDSPHRTSDDVAQGHAGTIRMLRSQLKR